MKLDINDIKKAQCDNLWTIGNMVLYDLCKTYPLHNNKKEFISKIWLIGRSYSAAIERRKQNRNISSDEFYESVIGEGLLKKGKKIDALILLLKNDTRISKNNINLVLELHSLLTENFKKLTGLNKRSLASKYLHFHLPNLFYIYDTRALKAINEIHKDYKHLITDLNIDLSSYPKYDKEYALFVAKMYSINFIIESQFLIWLTPRELDNLLLRF